ncbi:MAG: Arsenite-transporting ATPase [uncultured bacterium]|nr:MAG: Arsenite-transporting ATPase [uncultured bacterium]
MERINDQAAVEHRNTHPAKVLKIYDPAKCMQDDPHGWIVSRCFAVTDIEDPVLRAKSMDELFYIEEILARHARRIVVSPWVAEELRGIESFRHLR